MNTCKLTPAQLTERLFNSNDATIRLVVEKLVRLEAQVWSRPLEWRNAVTLRLHLQSVLIAREAAVAHDL